MKMSLNDIGNIIIRNESVSKTESIQNTNESTPKNSISNSKVLNKRLSLITDYIEIDYDDLDIYERCGRGSYGTVYKGLWKSRNKIVAVKKLLQLENEAEILSSCSHRNIIQFYGIVSKDSNFCIITEYAEYGSLRDFIKQHDLYEEFGLTLILKWAHDIALGMNYLHSEAPLKIIHRDLKSNNVLITNSDDLTCKICDFGSSRFGLQTTKMSLTGTFPWMSPEIIQSKPANQSADVWSYGVVLWELITGEIPFRGIEEFQIAFLVVEREHRLPIPNGCPPVLAHLMQLCWQTDPRSRPTFKQILSTLDQIDLDDNAKAEIDNLFVKNKAKWEIEIEQAFERLKKIEDDLHIKEKLLEAREKRLRDMEMELISNTSKLLSLEDHDVNSWTEIDVFEWIKKIGKKYSRDGIGAYCDKFLNHNINGKRLLLMSKADLRSIGILSEGHIIDLYHEIETLKIENIRLLNFPPLKQQTETKKQISLRTVSYNLLIGAHILHGQKPEDTKWKMYIDTDECDESKDVNVLSCIRDVKFVYRNQYEQYYVNKPPFLMRNWVRGMAEDAKVICTVTYENKVIQPRKTTLEYELKSNNTITHLIHLTLEGIDNSYLKTNNSSNTSSNTSTATAAIALISANIQFQSLNGSTSSSSPLGNLMNNSSSTENVWKKRNLENSVIIPPETQVKNSSDLWSGVVTGKYKTNNEQVNLLKKNTSVNEMQGSNEDNNNNKLIRSQTFVDKVLEHGKFSVTSSSSSNESTNTFKKDKNTNKNLTNNNFSKKLASNQIVLRRNLSGFGRGKITNLTDIKNEDINRKPLFF